MNGLKQFEDDINNAQKQIQKAISDLNDKYGNCLVFRVDITDVSITPKTIYLVSLDVAINQNYVSEVEK